MTLHLFQQGVGVVGADALNSNVQIAANVGELRAFTGNDGMQVSILGLVTPNDGGQGIFYYDPATTASDDGINIIVPWGNIQGAWVRLVVSIDANGVSNRQMRLALAAQSHLDVINNEIPSDVSNSLNIQWVSGARVVINDSLSFLIQSTLGYSGAQMIALFALAATEPE